MNITNLITVVSLIIAISMAAERLTEIVKGAIPFLNNENPDPQKEGWRTAAIQTLSVISGIITALLARPVIEGILKPLFCIGENQKPCAADQKWDDFPLVLALGVLSCAGAALWNSILEYLLKLKDIKEVEAKEKKLNLTEKQLSNVPLGGVNMLNVEIAINIVRNSIRNISGLGTSSPIRLQNTLKELLIRDNQLDLLRVDIVKRVPETAPPFKLDVGFLDGIDTDTTVGELVDIVSENSERA